MKPFRCMYDARRWYKRNAFGHVCTIYVTGTKYKGVNGLFKVKFISEALRFICVE